MLIGSDDIVTKIEFLLKEGAEIIKVQADEIDRLRNELKNIIFAGNRLLLFIDYKCSCRRDWICHRCETIKSWEEVCDKQLLNNEKIKKED